MVKFATVNVNGLINQYHQENLTNAILKGNFDVIGVQEINTNMYELPVGYEKIVNLGDPVENRRPRGTMILHRNGMTLGAVRKSADGRIIRAEFMDMTVVYLWTCQGGRERRHGNARRTSVT